MSTTEETTKGQENPDSAPRAQTRLGQYRLHERLGHGGMGEVWSAQHVRLDRWVAVKVVRPDALDVSDHRREAALERFEREARATAALTSPHTVQLLDFGRTVGGGFYYAMELLEGLTLEALVEEEGPVHPARVIHLLRQACDSLGEAHERGLIHRDVKPSNLFLSRRGLRHDYVKVLDFGLVKEVHEPSRERLTADDAMLGSPAFMPPELVAGVRGLDPRSDVYGLGCVAYWLLTGRLVFEHPHVLRIAFAHAHEPPPSPSSRTELPIPPRLEALVMACLEKRPDARPADARALRDALADCGVEPAWTELEAERWWRLHRGDITDRISLVSQSRAVDPAEPSRVLVVDDDAGVRMVVSRLLIQAGFEVSPAGSAMEALDLLATRPIDVVLTDLQMPGVGGLGLVAEIEARAPGLPVIVLTAHGSVPTAVEAMRKGARDFLTKPFDREELLAAIDRALD